MKLLQCALLAATIAAAEKLPVLSEPRAYQVAAGTSLTAWKDSAVVSRLGRIDFFTREDAGIVRGDSAVSSDINSERPRFINLFDTAHFVFARTDFLKHEKKWGIMRGFLSFDLGNGYPQGGVVRELSDWGDGLMQWSWRVLGCTENKAIEVAGSIGWGAHDSMSLPTASNLLCDVDQGAGRGVAMWRIPDGRHRIIRGEVKGLLHTLPADTMLFGADLPWVVAGWDSLWLTYNPKSRTLMSKDRNSMRFDSANVPELLGGAHFCSQVAHKDSLVVFGMDSSLVLLKWTPAGAKFVKQIPLPGAGAVQAVTASDSLVWVGTATALYSFRFDWQENATTSLTSRSRELTGLGVISDGRGASFVWSGSDRMALEIVALDGRKAGDLVLSDGQVSRWQAPHPGVYLACSSQGVKAFVVR